MSSTASFDPGVRRKEPAVRTAAEMWAEEAQRAWRRGEAASAAGNMAEARRWLERARRIVPDDATVALSLAFVALHDGALERAVALFDEILARYDVVEAWTGLAIAALRLQQTTRAVDAMQAVLSRHITPATSRALAAAVGRGRGWCAMDETGRLHADAPATLVLDGVELRLRWTGNTCRPLPGRSLVVMRDGVSLLGSPIDLTAIGAAEGFVAAEAGALVGWAWHPGNPGRDPRITVTGADGRTRDCMARESMDNASGTPLARRRRFRIEAADLPPGLLHVTGSDGRDLMGSPIDPAMERRSAAGLASSFTPVWADVVGTRPTARPRAAQRRRAVDVVVPVYRGLAQTLACLDSVLADLPRGSRVHVVDDAGPDPALSAALDALARAGRIRLIRQPYNQGFPAAANTGMAAAAGRDVVLLNSDTLVPPGWLAALAEAAYAAPDIGTACPLSNDATILSYPDPKKNNPMPDLAGTVRLAALARRANGAASVDIPVAVGFCMFIRRDCLDDVGLLREDLFAQGYGEENDFCLRARHRGWRHVAAAGAYVAHHGGASFGAARRHLLDRNSAILARLHPGYDAMIAAWQAQDALAPARRRMDVLRWRAGRRPGAVILVTHAGGGGVDRVIDQRVEALGATGLRPIVLRPKEDGSVVVGDGSTPNLSYAMPGEMDALVRLLRAEHPMHVELHHDLGHDPAVLDLAARLGVPHEIHVHDYAWFCPRIALVPEHTYCGEPPIAGCEACIADHGANIETDISVPALVERSSRLLGTAQQVVVPSADVATRLRRHFSTVVATVTPWEDDSAIPPPPIPKAVHHVGVIGGIGVEKGYEVLLACVRDAAARRLGLSFTVIGRTADDARLMEAGPAFVTGSYEEDELPALIQAHAPDLAFLPSIWPETWCFTLGHAWRCGLRAVVFDIGAPAERVRRTGWGWVLPLGLPAPAVNDTLLRLAPAPRTIRLPRRETPSQSRPNPAI